MIKGGRRSLFKWDEQRNAWQDINRKNGTDLKGNDIQHYTNLYVKKLDNLTVKTTDNKDDLYVHDKVKTGEVD